MGNIVGYPSAIITGSPGKSGKIQGLGIIAPFSPLDFGNVTGFYDPAVGVILNGADVSQWNDSSTSGNDITQGVAADQPLFVAGSPPLIEFDGVMEHLDRVSFVGGAISQPNTIVTVMQNFNFLNAFETFFDGMAARHLFDIRTSIPQFRMSSGGPVVQGGTPDTAKHIYVTIYNDLNTKLYVDGGAAVLSGGNIGSGAMNGFTIGGNASTTEFGHIRVSDAIIYDQLLSNSQIDQLGTFWATKHGLTWTNVI